jgi:hypothetical protein
MKLIFFILVFALPNSFAKKVKWEVLEQLDIEKKEIKKNKNGKELIKLVESKKDIQLAGFMIPMDYDDKTIKEFLLIPNPMGCMHLPPPAPNQMVLVKVKKGKVVGYSWNAIWVHGKLSIASPYLKKNKKKRDNNSTKQMTEDEDVPSYVMEAEKVSDFKEKKLDYIKALQ